MPATISTKREMKTERRYGMRGRKIMEYQVGRDLTELLRKSNNSNSTQIGNAK